MTADPRKQTIYYPLHTLYRMQRHALQFGIKNAGCEPSWHMPNPEYLKSHAASKLGKEITSAWYWVPYCAEQATSIASSWPENPTCKDRLLLCVRATSQRLRAAGESLPPISQTIFLSSWAHSVNNHIDSTAPLLEQGLQRLHVSGLIDHNQCVDVCCV